MSETTDPLKDVGAVQLLDDLVVTVVRRRSMLEITKEYQEALRKWQETANQIDYPGTFNAYLQKQAEEMAKVGPIHSADPRRATGYGWEWSWQITPKSK